MTTEEQVKEEPITVEEQAKVEELKQQEDVQQALKQTAGNKEPAKPVVETKHKVYLGTYFILLLGLGGLYYLLGLRYFGLAAEAARLLQRFTTGGMAIVLVLAV